MLVIREIANSTNSLCLLHKCCFLRQVNNTSVQYSQLQQNVSSIRNKLMIIRIYFYFLFIFDEVDRMPFISDCPGGVYGTIVSFNAY